MRFEVRTQDHSLEHSVYRQVDVLRRGVAVARVLDRSVEFALAPLLAEDPLPEKEPFASAVLLPRQTLEQVTAGQQADLDLRPRLLPVGHGLLEAFTRLLAAGVARVVGEVVGGAEGQLAQPGPLLGRGLERVAHRLQQIVGTRDVFHLPAGLGAVRMAPVPLDTGIRRRGLDELGVRRRRVTQLETELLKPPVLGTVPLPDSVETVGDSRTRRHHSHHLRPNRRHKNALTQGARAQTGSAAAPRQTKTKYRGQRRGDACLPLVGALVRQRPPSRILLLRSARPLSSLGARHSEPWLLPRAKAVAPRPNSRLYGRRLT